MDYNYVRMRNAESRGDAELAAKYRALYKKGKSGADSNILNWLIALLLSVAVALGIYIAAVGIGNTAVPEPEPEPEQPAEETVIEEEPDYVSRPDDGTGTENGENP